MNDKKQDEMQDENAIIMERRSKLKEIRERGIAFPNQFKPENFSQKLHELYDDKSKDELAEENITVSVAGRMMLKRVMGKASFATIQDRYGRIQLYVTRDLINNESNPELYLSLIHI